MKSQLLLPLLLCIAVLGACAQGRKTAKSPVSAPAASPVKSISSVTMRRGACFGRCPEYSLTIKSSGLAEYSGTRNAEPMGVYQKNIGASTAQELLREFMKLRVDTCQDLYQAKIADLPGMYFSFIIDSKEKKIGNAHFGPPFLLTMGQRMDEIGMIDKTWKKIRNAE